MVSLRRNVVPFVLCILQLTICSRLTISAADDTRKVVIPFDFASSWDSGRYGKIVGEMIWKKLEREGGIILPETMQDVRDVCERIRFKPSLKTPLDKMRNVIREDFEAQIGIWGSIERVDGTEGDIYDLTIQCVDFSNTQTKVIYQVKARTKSVSEIPHLYVKQMLDALYGWKPLDPPPADKMVEENWVKNPNLLVGGDFQSGVGGVPKGWEKVAGQQREPLGKLVNWISDKDNSKNKFIRFEFPQVVGDNEGVMYYSDLFPVEEGAKYRFQCHYRTDGPMVKVFIKGYDAERSPYQTSKTPVHVPAKGDKNAFIPEESQRREVYRAQMNLQGKKNQWNTHTQEFTPKHPKYSPKWGRVMLYAYLGAGMVDFDDVIVKQIISPSPGEKQKEHKHSSATEVTIEEMEKKEKKQDQ
jgi:hypothetical protein